MTFDTLGLSADLLRTVAEEGYTDPTPVQAAAIPLVLAGRDVLAAAQTGTGKTAAFTLPILDRLAAARQHQLLAGPPPGPRPHPRPDPRARDAGRRERPDVRPDRPAALDRRLRRRSRWIPRSRRSAAGVEILVATPGRLLDLVGQQVANLGQVEILVLDEADRMLDMGFLPDIQRIIALLPARRQNLMFSATFSDDIRRLSGTILRDPATVEVAPRNTDRRGASASSSTRSIATARRRCSPTSSGRDDLRQVLVFTRTKLAATRLAVAARPRGPRRRRDPLATARSRSGRARSRASRPARSGCSSRPTSPPAASTSRTCRSSSTSSCRGTRRTTSTGSAGPGGPARRARRSRLVCIDETDLLRGVQRMLRQAIPWTVEDGFIPDRERASRGRSAMRAGHARVDARRTMPIASRSVGGRVRRRRAAGRAAGRRVGRARSARRRARRRLGDRLGRGVARSSRSSLGESIAAPGKKKPSIMSALDPVDAVAVDEGVVADVDGLASGRRARRQPDVAQEHELAASAA